MHENSVPTYSLTHYSVLAENAQTTSIIKNPQILCRGNPIWTGPSAQTSKQEEQEVRYTKVIINQVRMQTGDERVLPSPEMDTDSISLAKG